MFALKSRGLTALSLVICLGLGLANDVSPAKQFKVRSFGVTIEVASDHHKARIESYLRRSLRRIDDIEIVYDSPFRKISVVHLQRDSGLHIFSIVFLTCRASVSLSEAEADRLIRLPDDSITGLVVMAQVDKMNVETKGIVESHFLISGGSLQEICESIIAQFDNELESMRQMRGEVESYFKELGQ